MVTSESHMLLPPHGAQPYGQPDRLQAALAGSLRRFAPPAAGYLRR